MSLPYQIDEAIPEGEVLEGGSMRKGKKKHNNVHFHWCRHTPTQIHRRDTELSLADKQMTDK